MQITPKHTAYTHKKKAINEIVKIVQGLERSTIEGENDGEWSRQQKRKVKAKLDEIMPEMRRLRNLAWNGDDAAALNQMVQMINQKSYLFNIELDLLKKYVEAPKTDGTTGYRYEYRIRMERI